MLARLRHQDLRVGFRLIPCLHCDLGNNLVGMSRIWKSVSKDPLMLLSIGCVLLVWVMVGLFLYWSM
jgi:hypothetical protein